MYECLKNKNSVFISCFTSHLLSTLQLKVDRDFVHYSFKQSVSNVFVNCVILAVVLRNCTL